MYQQRFIVTIKHPERHICLLYRTEVRGELLNAVSRVGYIYGRGKKDELEVLVLKNV
jgi:hypothetical protein